MTLKTQSKVLRALETQRFEPVGAHSTVTVDVRVIAATNKNLDQEMERGNFREDLFYRLNVIPFYVPPLRDRTEDIPVLAKFFIGDFSRHYGQPPKELSAEAVDLLTAHSLARQRSRVEEPGRASGDHDARTQNRSPAPARRGAQAQRRPGRPGRGQEPVGGPHGLRP